MAHSTRRASSAKSRPEKQPSPLWLHKATGQYGKTIRGVKYYFGSDRDAALKEYLRVREWREKGLEPPPKEGEYLTLVRLCNHFIAAAKAKVQSEELTNRTYQEYERTCELLMDHFGKKFPVNQLGPKTLLAYRQKLASGRAPQTIATEVNRARVVLTFAFKSGLIDKPILFGEFKRPSVQVMRKRKAAVGDVALSAWEIRRLINGASPTLRAMILLAVNCGLGNADLGRLEHRHLDLEKGWLDFPRPKTGIPRRARLWPETVRTLKWASQERPTAKDQADDRFVFITKYGKPWSTGEQTDTALSHEFKKLRKAVGNVSDLGFYSLRRSFRTAADAARDPVAVDLVMGHADHTMGGQYRQKIEGKRLTRVSRIVRSWLWPIGGAE